MLKHFHIIAFTHRNIAVEEIGKLHIEETKQQSRLQQLKDTMELDEIMFLSTCNRVEFQFCTAVVPDLNILNLFFTALYPEFTPIEIQKFAETAVVFNGIDAVEHILRVASSIDSMVVGEREIITQVRNAYDASKRMNLTGDFIRIVIRQTIETAKKVYTETSIATKPVSVVSLAYHRLRDMNIPMSARIILIGAGTTNTNMARFLKKHGFKNFVIFNRTLSKAQGLAQDLKGEAFALTELQAYQGGFDVIITCTGSEDHIITPEIYTNLLNGDIDRKVVIDIALPQDLHPKIVAHQNVTHISVNTLQKISNENLKERSKEIEHVEEIINEAVIDFKQIQKMRTVELAMQNVPKKVKEIREIAVNEVFKNELDSLDNNCREVVEKIINYMEKKYISVPMIMAKEILLKN